VRAHVSSAPLSGHADLQRLLSILDHRTAEQAQNKGEVLKPILGVCDDRLGDITCAHIVGHLKVVFCPPHNTFEATRDPSVLCTLAAFASCSKVVLPGGHRCR
jgi:hypothetical protein